MCFIYNLKVDVICQYYVVVWLWLDEVQGDYEASFSSVESFLCGLLIVLSIFELESLMDMDLFLSVGHNHKTQNFYQNWGT